MARQRRGRSSSPRSRNSVPSIASCASVNQSCAHVANPEAPSPKAIRNDADYIPYHSRDVCHGFVCQHEPYARLSRLFSAYDDAHGAIDVRVLLWGPAGSGKRQLSTHFANTQALACSRTILWIDGSTSTTFVRDLRLAYQLMTGKVQRSGVSVPWQLFRIARALSECKSKWFMVVFDFNPDLQSASLNKTGFDLATYLPDGQILITYSPKLNASNVFPLTMTEVPFEFSLRNINHIERLTTSDTSFVQAMVNKTQLAMFDDVPCSDSSLQRFSQHLLSAAIGLSTARLSNLPLDRYQHLLRKQKLRSMSTRLHHASPAGMLATFATTMDLFMDTLRDLDPIAEDFLIALASICPRDVSLCLVQKLRLFRDRAFQLEDTVDLLQGTSVIEVKVLPDNEKYISMHSMVHKWLNAKFRRPKNIVDPTFRKAVGQWVSLLDRELPEIQHESHKQKYWILLHHVQTVARNAEYLDSRGSFLISLLRKTATFMSEFVITPHEANRLLARALFLTADLRTEDTEFSIELERLKLHCERSQLCTVLGDLSHARQEVDYAQSCLGTLESPDVRKMFQQDLNEKLIELLLQQDNHNQARLLIGNVLATNPDLPPEKKSKLHYWAACCRTDDRISLLTALQHSHMAMSYWQTLPEDEKWGSKSFSMITCVDSHIDLLLQMDQDRGALVFMPKLLDYYIQQCPPTTASIWRLAYSLVRMNIGILELDAAEEVACRVLTLCSFDQLEGLPLAWGLTMLHAVGSMFARTGRYLESEGIFRTCLTAIEMRRPPDVSGQGEFPVVNLWLELCHSLLVQGKVKQAEAARTIAVEKGVENLKGDDWKANALFPCRSLQRVYDRVLQAARDRLEGIYNVDDDLLDVSWPKTFSIAIQVLGNPFDHIKNGMDGVSNVLIPTAETLGEHSLVLELLGFHFDSTDSDTSSKCEDDQTNWYAVFDAELSAVGDSQQTKMDKYWRWCDCRRQRKRTSSIGYDITFHNRITRREEERAERRKTKVTKPPIQKQITEMLPRLRRYPATACPPNCPCIKANAESEGLISELESERLYSWRSSNEKEHAARQAAYLRALRQYRYRCGPRPAVPYGMSFITRWKKPRGPTEPNGDAKKQHEFFWAPDFVFSADPEINWGFLGQEENYLFSHPAMTIRPNGAPGGLPDLPNIVISSYKLGEPVRANNDRFVSKSRKIWIQTNILDYLDETEDELDMARDNSSKQGRSTDVQTPASGTTPRRESSASGRPIRRRGRNPYRVPLPASRSGSEISSPSRSRSRSTSSVNTDRNVSNDNTIRKVVTRPDLSSKLKLFSIDSSHTLGPVFDVDDFNEQTFQALRTKLPLTMNAQNLDGVAQQQEQQPPPPQEATTVDEDGMGAISAPADTTMTNSIHDHDDNDNDKSNEAEVISPSN